MIRFLAAVFALLALHGRVEAQWYFDEGAAMAQNSRGDVATIACNGATPRVIIAMDGTSGSRRATVDVLFDGSGFRTEWAANSGLGVIAVIADGATAISFVRRARPARLVTIATGGYRTSFGLSGVTAATNRLPCVDRIRNEEAAARAETERRNAAARARADSVRVAEEAAKAAQREADRLATLRRDSIARVAAVREDSLRRIAQIRRDSIRADSTTRAARARAEREKRPALWIGAEAGMGYVVKEFGMQFSALAGGEWRWIRATLRPVDVFLVPKSNSDPAMIFRFGADIRTAIPNGNTEFSIGGGALQYPIENRHDFKQPVDQGLRPYLLVGMHSSKRIGLRAGMDVRAFDNGVEILLAVYGAFR